MASYSQNPIADATVWDHRPTTNIGTQEYLYIGEFSSGEIAEIFVKFDLSSLLTGYVVNGAYLRMYQYDSVNDWLSPTIQVAAELCGAAWTETGITWNTKPANAAATPQALTSFANNISSYVQFDVKSHVQAIVDGTYTNNGFRLRYTGTSSETAKYFRSREYGTTAKRPVLVIDYTDLPNPSDPVLNSIATVTAASKTFTWTASTDPIFAQSELYYEMQISFNNGTSYDATVKTSNEGVASCTIDIKSADYLNIAAGRYYYNTQCKIRVRAKTPAYGGTNYYSEWVVSPAFTIDYRITPGAPASLTPSDSTPYEGETINFTCGRPATYNTHDDDGNANVLDYYVQLSNGTALAHDDADVTNATKAVTYTVGNLTSGTSDLSTNIRAYCVDAEGQTGTFCDNVAITFKRFRTPVINISSIDRNETTAVVHVTVLDTGYGGVQANTQITKLTYSLAGAAYADATLDGAWSGLTNSFTVGDGTNGAPLVAGTAYALGVKVVNDAPADTALSDLTSAAVSETILAFTPGGFWDELGVCAKSALVHSDFSTAVGAGCAVIENDLDVGGSITLPEWAAWTPTLTNITIGNGTTTARTMAIGKTRFFNIRIVLGNTSTVDGSISFTLPANAKSRCDFFGTILDYGTTYYAVRSGVNAGSASANVRACNAAGTNLQADTACSSTVPMTWAENDAITINGSYEEE